MDITTLHPRRIEVIEATLSVGGQRLAWQFGENTIRTALTLLQKSNVDIIECGLLCSYSAGLNSAIYISTSLPVGVKRDENQQFALMLDKYSRPLLDSIPKRSEKTVDIIRLFFTSENESEDIDYCQALMAKGYLIVIMIDEPAQYDSVEFAERIKAINAINPWCCTICDSSGLMTVIQLQDALRTMSQLLNNDILIGFQGHDNLQILSQIIESVLSDNTTHGIVLDSGIGGLSDGAPQISTEIICEILKRRYSGNYSLPALHYLSEILGECVKKMLSPSNAFKYLSAAKAKCAYTYADYFSQINIGADEQAGIFSFINRKAAYTFNKMAANQAIVDCMKVKKNIAIVTVTKNRSMQIERLLSHGAEGAMKCGVDWIILDNSDDDRTAVCVKGFQIDCLPNIYYQRVPEKISNDRNQTLFMAYQIGLDYDYVWVLYDDWVPTIDECYYELLNMLHTGVDLVIVDALYRNGNRKRKIRYQNCLDFFSENSNRLAISSQYVIKSSLAKEILNRCQADNIDGSYWLMESTMRVLTEQKNTTGLLISHTLFCYDDDFVISCECNNTIQTWAYDWYDAVTALPDIFSPSKHEAVHFRTQDIQPFRIHALLGQRGSGEFTLSQYRKNKDRLLAVSDTSNWKFVFVALIPKSMARIVYRQLHSGEKKADNRVHKFFRKLKNLYIRLGR